MAQFDPAELHRRNLPVWVLAGGSRAGVYALSARLIEAIDSQQVDIEKLARAYGRWVTFTSVLTRRLVDQAESASELPEPLFELVEGAPEFNHQMGCFLASPSREGLLHVADQWLLMRRSTQSLLRELLG